MSYIKEKASHLCGLAKGLGVSSDTTGKLLNEIIATLDSTADALDENEAAIMELEECMDDIYEEIDNIDELLYDEEDDDDDFVEFECPSCGETAYFDKEMLENSEDLICPACNAPIVTDADSDED